MLLTPTATLDAKVRTTLADNKVSINEVRFLGGKSAVSPAVRTKVETALK